MEESRGAMDKLERTKKREGRVEETKEGTEEKNLFMCEWIMKAVLRVCLTRVLSLPRISSASLTLSWRFFEQTRMGPSRSFTELR